MWEEPARPSVNPISPQRRALIALRGHPPNVDTPADDTSNPCVAPASVPMHAAPPAIAMHVEPIPLPRNPTGSCLSGPGYAGVLNFGLSVRRVPVVPGSCVNTSFSPPVTPGRG